MDNREGQPKTSRDFFRTFETSASNSKSKEPTSENSLISTATSQNSAEKTSFYTPSVTKAKSNHKLNLKRSAPLVAIISALTVCLFVIFGSTSLLGAHLEALYTEATDTQYTSNTLRSTRLFSYMLTGDNKITTSWSGARKYKTFSPWLKSRLKKSGITVAGDALEFKGQTITADNFSTTYRDNVEFREAYTTAKRGRVAGFFDNAAERVYQKLGLSRNLFENFKQTGDTDADTANYNKIMSAEFETSSLDVSTKSVDEETTTDENGNPKTTKSKAADSDSASQASGDSPTAKASAYLTKATAAVSTACGALKIGSLLATTVSAVETYSTIHFYQNINENYSKSKYGDGDAAAVHQVNNFFTKSVTTEYPDPETGEMVTITGAPLEGESERVILGGVKPDFEKAIKHSLSRLEKTLKGTMLTFGATATTCSLAGAANAALSLATLAIPGGGFIKLTTSLLLDTAIKVGAQIAITSALSFLVPTLARTLFENHFEKLQGIPAGEAYGKGAAAANTNLAARASGQSGASEEKLAAYSRQTSEVLALDAELDRKTHSPFDATNKNTFLGSIVGSALSFATTTSAISPLSTISNLTTGSLAKLSGSAFADSNTKYFDYYGDCPNLDEIGVKGDLYCNRITATDPSTLDLSPDAEAYIAVISPNLETDEEGNEVIKDGSRLAKYINFCANRESPWGIYDANIAASFETTLGPGDALPYLGDAVAIINAIENLDPEVELWAKGTICNDSPENPYWDTEIKYYQRYLEDNRILDQFGVFREDDLEDPVLAYENRYDAAHPADLSLSGTLARITGSTKDDINTMLAVVDYYALLADYHPENKLVFGNSLASEPVTLEGLFGVTFGWAPIVRTLTRSNQWDGPEWQDPKYPSDEPTRRREETVA